MFLFRRINLLLLSFNLLNSVECGIPLYFEYDGDSWTTNWTHSNRKKGDKIVDDWVDTDLKVEYIKAEEWPASLTASEKDWEFVRKVTGEVMSIVRKVIYQVRKRPDNRKILIPRRCSSGEMPRQSVRSQKCRPTEGEQCSKEAWCFDLPIRLPDYANGCGNEGVEDLLYKDGKGVDTDLLAFVSLDNCEGSKLADAIYCQRDPQYSRPVAGRIKVCANKIKDYRKTPKKMMQILLHEFFHVLLQPMDAKSYVNEDGSRKQYAFNKINRKWKSATGEYDRTVVYSTLPKVVEVVREHFNCSDLEGVEMDNSSMYIETFDWNFAHFEARLFPDALMSPIHISGLQLSKLDLAYLYETGWYHVNMSMGRKLSVTRGKGCDFARTSCYEYMQNKTYDRIAIYPYCNKEDRTKWMCTLDNNHVGHCSGHVTTSNVPGEFRLQAAGDMFAAGSYAEYCPMVIPNKVDFDTSPYCNEAGDVAYRAVGAVGGSSDSRCIRFETLTSVYSAQTCPNIVSKHVGVCVVSECTLDSIVFSFGGIKHECSKSESGQRKDYDFTTNPNSCKIYGSFCCPDFEMFCNRSESNQPPIIRFDYCRASFHFLNRLISLILTLLLIIVLV